MKIKTPLKVSKALGKGFLAVAAVILFSSSGASAVPVSFSGAEGGPLSMTLLFPVKYVVTVSDLGSSPVFVLEGVGDFLPFTLVTGDLAYTVNGGSPQSILGMQTGFTGISVTPDDLIFSAALTPGVDVDDVILLNAGTVLTAISVDGPPPANGDFATFIADTSGRRLSGDGVVVPDALATLWLALPLTLMLAFAGLNRCARRCQAFQAVKFKEVPRFN